MSRLEGKVWVADPRPDGTHPGQCAHKWSTARRQAKAECASCPATCRRDERGKISEYSVDKREDERDARRPPRRNRDE